MKTLGKILGGVVIAVIACAIVALIVLSVTGLDAKDRRAGMWLKGQVVDTPVDWSFTDKYPTIQVETHPWWQVPLTVTINCVTYNGHLYLHSNYSKSLPFPASKHWTAAIARDPNVRIKIGNQVFDRTAIPVTDQTETAALFDATHKKYPRAKLASNMTIYFFRVQDPS